MRFEAEPRTHSVRNPWLVACVLAIVGAGLLLDTLLLGKPSGHYLGAVVAFAAAGLVAAWAAWLSPAVLPARCEDCGAELAEEGAPCLDCGEDEGAGDGAPGGPFPLGRGRGGGVDAAGPGGARFPLGRGPRAGARRGFTLIEIIMAVTITVLVFGMIGGILLSVIDATEKVGAKLQTEKAGYGLLSLVRRDLTGVYAYSLGGPAFDGEDRTEFGQDADELHFVTTANVVESEDGDRPSFVEVGYRFEAGQDDDLVMFRRAVPLSGDPLSAGGEYVELLRGVQSFNLEYLDPEEQAWKPRWQDEEDLPDAVKVVLELQLTERQQRYAESAQLTIPPPRYEMVVGLTAAAALPEQEGGGGQGGPPGN